MMEHDICKTCICIKTCAFLKKRGVLPKKQTNADRIRAMTDEELAKFIAERNPDLPDVFAECVLEWLKKEVDDGKV